MLFNATELTNTILNKRNSARNKQLSLWFLLFTDLCLSLGMIAWGVIASFSIGCGYGHNGANAAYAVVLLIPG